MKITDFVQDEIENIFKMENLKERKEKTSKP